MVDGDFDSLVRVAASTVTVVVVVFVIMDFTLLILLLTIPAPWSLEAKPLSFAWQGSSALSR